MYTLFENQARTCKLCLQKLLVFRHFTTAKSSGNESCTEGAHCILTACFVAGIPGLKANSSRTSDNEHFCTVSLLFD